MNTLKLILTAAALSLATPALTAHAEPADTVQAAGTHITANVKGMVCDFCAQAVTKVFGKHDAVDSVKVDLDNGAIHVDLKPGKSISDDEVKTLVKKSGYALISIDREAA